MSESRRPQDKWRHAAGQSSARSGAAVSAGKPRTSRLFLGALLLAALVGVVVGLLSFFRSAPKPIFLSIAVTEYSDRNFPVNAFAQQDSEALRQQFGTDSVQAFQSQERDLILRELSQLEARSRGADSGRPIIIHLSANAFVYDGVVQLIPGNGQSGSPATWIRLSEVVDLVKRIAGHRLLLLDLRPVVDARLGILGDDLPDAVKELFDTFEQANDLPFQVLIACGPQSTPVVMRELKRSAFGWFLERGLAGIADGWNSARNKDERIAPLELMTFTRDQVAGLSGKLNQSEIPFIRGRDQEIVVAAVPQGGAKPAPAAEEAEVYPASLLAYWQERDRWNDTGYARRLPRTSRQLEAALMRAESQWLGGIETEKWQRELDAEVQQLRAVKQRFPDPVPPIRSIAAAQKRGIANLREAEVALAPLIDKIKATPSPKMEDMAEFQKLRTALREKPLDAAAVASIIYDVALDRREPTVEQLKQLVLALQIAPDASKFVDSSVLRMLTEVERNRLKLWEPEQGTISLILLTSQSAERAVAVDGRALPWLQKELQEVDSMRRQALVALLQAESDERANARRQLERCRQRYDALALAGKALEDALRERDETLGFLAGWAGFEASDGRRQDELDALWNSIVSECRELLPLLKPPGEPALPDAQLLSNKANDLRHRREQMLELVKGDPTVSAAALPHLLAWPFWKGEQRQELANRTRSGGLVAVQQALQDTGAKPGEVAELPPANPIAVNKHAFRRARQAIDILLLADDPEANKLNARWNALPKTAEAREMAALGTSISRQWSERLPERYRQSKTLDEQARIGWAIHPFDYSAIPRSGDSVPRDAAGELYRRQQKDFASWIGEFRDQADAAALGKVEGLGAARLARALQELAREQLGWNP